MADEQKKLVAAEEEQKISRRMMAWVNSYPDFPATISKVDFEQLPAKSAGMALSVMQGAYITHRYITGGHEAQYDFSLLYRIIPGTSNDARLKADEALNAVSDWAAQNWPEIGEGIRIRSLETTQRAALLVPYEDGSEDHQITFKLLYEVI